MKSEDTVIPAKAGISSGHGCPLDPGFRRGDDFIHLRAGAISGFDATFESTVAKLMFLIGHKYDKEEIKIRMRVPLVGEITRPEDRVNETI